MGITLFSHKGGPNPWKVAIVLEELGLKYEHKFLDFNTGEHKQPAYTKYNPNGRVPCIIDHDNNDFTLWESAAIIIYLVERYDKSQKLSYQSGNEKYIQAQWLAFQISGQGPYFGQAAWFMNFHPEKLPSAIERYQKEIERVISVLDTVLASQPYLIPGPKLTVADLSFITWNSMIPYLTSSNPSVSENLGAGAGGKYPHFRRWHEEMVSRPAVKKVLEEKAKASA